MTTYDVEWPVRVSSPFFTGRRGHLANKNIAPRYFYLFFNTKITTAARFFLDNQGRSRVTIATLAFCCRLRKPSVLFCCCCSPGLSIWEAKRAINHHLFNGVGSGRCKHGCKTACNPLSPCCCYARISPQCTYLHPAFSSSSNCVRVIILGLLTVAATPNRQPTERFGCRRHHR